jgi:hypothetical protein
MPSGFELSNSFANGCGMTKSSQNGPNEDDVLQRELKTPPVTPKAKLKASPGRPATKAEHAALKRIDKTVIKRMRKR